MEGGNVSKQHVNVPSQMLRIAPFVNYAMCYSSTCHERPPPVRSESGPSWQGTENHGIESKT